MLGPPVVPVPVPCDGERDGSDDDEPAPDGDEVLLGKELAPDAGELPPAAEPCTLEDVPLVGGQEQFNAPALDCAPGAADEVLLPAVPPELVVLDGVLLIAALPSLLELCAEPGTPDEDALGGQAQFCASLLEPLAVVPPAAAGPVAFSERPPAPDGAVGEFWVVCDC